MIDIQDLEIKDVKLITIKRYCDNRGWLNESWRDSWSKNIGLPNGFVQDMLSFNERANILRGLHALKSPAEQYKLVSVISGKIFDVVVDARKESPTYKKYVSVILSVDAPFMIFIPPGCYHGYLTLEPNTGVYYKVSHYHSHEYDSGLKWNDPDIGIPWPLNNQEPIISERDKQHPLLREL